MALPETPEQKQAVIKALKDHVEMLANPRSGVMESMAALEEKNRKDVAQILGIDFGKLGGESVVVEVERKDNYFFETHRLNTEEKERMKADGGKPGNITAWVTKINGVQIVEELNIEDEKVMMRDAAGYRENGGVWLEAEAAGESEAEEPEKDERLVEVAPHVHANLRKVFGS